MTAMTTAEEISAYRTETNRGDKLRGRVAFVTGGTRGIGAAIRKSLVSQGATVAAGYSSNRERAEQFVEEMTRGGAHASVHQGNVGEPATHTWTLLGVHTIFLPGTHPESTGYIPPETPLDPAQIDAARRLHHGSAVRLSAALRGS